MLRLDHPISNLRGAEYNPRRIAADDLAALADSLRTLGVVKPIIARGDLIDAGHQRVTALRQMGVTHAPVYLLPVETTTYDEVRFNQLHNGTDLDGGDENCSITGPLPALGFATIEAARIRGNFRAGMAVVRTEICRLVQKFGGWGAAVVTQDGDVIHCAQYALEIGRASCRERV